MATIAIRADGGSQIGMGHIMRTLVLAKELAKTNDVFYLCRIDKPLSGRYSYGIEKVKNEGFKVITIDENNVLGELERIQCDCLITDSYDVDERYFTKTKELFKKTGYFDDMNLYHFDVDFIINQNINAEYLNYNTDKRTILFLGPGFALLRDEFRKSKIKKVNEVVKDILITLGGSDFNNYTAKILQLIKELRYNFHVVVGPSFKYIDELSNYEKMNSNIKLHFNTNMKALMDRCDIAISACGSTLYELAACGVPALGLIIAENQKEIAKKMEQEKLIINLGPIDKLNKEKLVNTVEELCSDLNRRKQMNYNQSIVIDKNGAEKLCKNIMVAIG
ncbi:UDP-2,4-diacetamido-2,4,6-trideoxy-beta-L-altropyranose hydrolase [Clostridium coskatii]|uniref:UDP-2,4-diacetamido-2,4, 6-trideoxy-beta-L-altropyranose hydrolase n=1 Tax=Clostridium coskatii TaxID=1705578 RepID=A0A162LFA8_9CLOT|nr:UDP-2,4-diacetamido-2,4,6-trideoxy-beta-L-altropyranose hydrolase [Clostridium coskatii]OAA92756.1 UDP-2,4-diacetamido-2,4,6-trideoxy-beta-L-altropyranose hydrolase [Clostridium coskatii]OBR97711.1 UDP-2,4-diacetamido-2,4,6-trideoxy-beta-L-altropyranose hydrolase [Clostridium coskatii]